VERDAAGERWVVRGPARLEGVLRPPGDKSIAHRALLLAALARGRSELRNLPAGDDVRRTIAALAALGVRIERSGDTHRVHGVGLHGFRPPRDPLDCGNSGTTMRLLAGLLAPQPFETLLVGDASLTLRPMSRIVEPLAAMGARIACLGPRGRPPLRLGGTTTTLRAIEHRLAVDSAQVRSALLFAGLYAAGPTCLQPASASRDHTERMLHALGVQITRAGERTVLYPTRPEGWSAFAIDIPGDLSSAAFHVAFAAATPGSDLRVEGVGLNPGRGRYLALVAEHGAALRTVGAGDSLGEPRGTLRVVGGRLRPLHLAGRDTVQCIDEIPALAAAWAVAGVPLRVRDAGELRVKESDRIAKLVELVTSFGGVARAQPRGFDVAGSKPSRPARFDAAGDHRLAMAAAMLALGTEGASHLLGTECVRTSYPEFVADLARILRPVRKGPSHPRPAVRKRA